MTASTVLDPRRQRPLRPRRRASVRRRRLAGARANAPRFGCRHAGVGAAHRRGHRRRSTCSREAPPAHRSSSTRVNPIYTRWQQEAVPMARAGMDIAQRLGATFMLPGNVYNYGADDAGAAARSTRRSGATTAQGRSCASRSRTRWQRAADRGLRGVVMRAGDFYGSGSGSWLDLADRQVDARGQARLPGPAERAACLGLPARPRALPSSRVAAARAIAAGVRAFALRRPHADRRATC